MPLRIGLAFWLWASRSLLPAAVEFVIRPLDRCLWRTPQDFFTPLAIAAQLALWAGVLLALPNAILLLSALSSLVRSNHFDRRIDGILVLSLVYVLWFGLIPLASLVKWLLLLR